jgi:hypothetical protein
MKKEEGRRKKEEGRRKKEEGRNQPPLREGRRKINSQLPIFNFQFSMTNDNDQFPMPNYQLPIIQIYI